MSKINKRSFFSISFEFVTVGEPILHDLYINSSSAANRDHFVRIFPKGGVPEKEDINHFRQKYHQLYVLEEQRDLYLKSLVKNSRVPDTKKTEVIKESAIHYLDTIFSEDKIFQTEVLGEAIEGCRESVETMVEVVQDYSINEIQELIANLSFHDFYTYDHSINVSMYNISIFKTMKPNATKQELILAGMGGLLHDLGKINIPTEIINNSGKLSDEDFNIIKTHPEEGKKLVEQHVKNFGNLDIEVIKRVISEHHENYNGTGYPGKVKGKDIHVFARITALGDFFDAVTTKRS
ncbi:MAG: HD domain-containing protein, partial [Bacteriovoracaceae bacterium]|nr:HD domain-containing protein [Bacteriovoracaceae bacterium]